MKITHSDKKITPFGGFNFCHDLMCKTGIPNLIDKHLGKRVKYIGFDYSDILANYMAIFMNGGDCTEDINEHLRGHLNQVRGLSVCSADTILRGIKELSTPTQELISASGIKHEFNINTKLNELLLKASVKTGLLDKHTGYTLDYDNQVIATEKYDAKKTYKKCDGYQPGVAGIGKLIVYVEGRNGNSQAKYQQAQTLQRTFSLLESQLVQTKRFRADSASYQQDVIEIVKQKSQYFYIRAMRCANMEQQISQVATGAWQKIRLGVQEMQVAEIKDYQPFGGEETRSEERRVGKECRSRWSPYH